MRLTLHSAGSGNAKSPASCEAGLLYIPLLMKNTYCLMIFTVCPFSNLIIYIPAV